jgi:hypothetical protein
MKHFSKQKILGLIIAIVGSVGLWYFSILSWRLNQFDQGMDSLSFAITCCGLTLYYGRGTPGKHVVIVLAAWLMLMGVPAFVIEVVYAFLKSPHFSFAELVARILMILNGLYWIHQYRRHKKIQAIS